MIPDPASTPLAGSSPGPLQDRIEANGPATPGAALERATAPIPTPSLKPGEVITWLRIERPRLELGQILVGSFVLVGLTMAIAVSVGILLGHLKSKSTNTHGAGGLNLR